MMISPFVFAIMTLSSLMVCLVMMDLGTPVISATRVDSCEIRLLVWSFMLPYVVIARGRKVVVSMTLFICTRYLLVLWVSLVLKALLTSLCAPLFKLEVLWGSVKVTSKIIFF